MRMLSSLYGRSLSYSTVIDIQLQYEFKSAVFTTPRGWLRIRGKLARGYWDGGGIMIHTSEDSDINIEGMSALRDYEIFEAEQSIHLGHDFKQKYLHILFDTRRDGYSIHEDLYFLTTMRAN